MNCLLTIVWPVFGFNEIGEFMINTCGERVILEFTVYGFVQNTTAEVERDKLKTFFILRVSTSTCVSFNNKVIRPTLYPYVPYFGFGLMFVYPISPM